MHHALAALTAVSLLAACHGGHHAPPPAPPAPLPEAAIAIPIAPGQTGAWQAALAELIGPRYAEYDTSRRRFGLTSQTTFLQQTPMGDFAVIHLTGADVRASFHAMSTSQDPWDVAWRQMTQSLHGLDFARGSSAPQVELAYTTGEPIAAEGAQPYLFLAPLGPDAVPRFRALAAEIAGPRRAAYLASRARLGVQREAVFLEQTPRGDAAVFYWLATDPRASLRALAASADPFDAWLRDAATAVHPVPLAALAEIAGHNQLVAQYPHPR